METRNAYPRALFVLAALCAPLVFKSALAAAQADEDAQAAHAQIALEDRYPPAAKCASCHPKQYREWSVSQHAYAQLSPVYMAMQATINLLTSATNGDFCLRCHTPVGTDIEEPLALTNLDRNPASREGVTCITCHRVALAYGKISGRLALDEGPLVAPVKGPLGDEGLQAVLADKETYRNLSTDPGNSRGKKVHAEIDHFFELTSSRFCGNCHDVLLVNGFRLEEAFSDYKTSPAHERGVTCQDCHMGKVQGRDEGYEHGPAALIGKADTPERKITNHYFAGPDYSIVHPGIFPHPLNPPRNLRKKTLRDWIAFDYAAEWGEAKFEKDAAKKTTFPDSWKTTSHRKAARRLIVEQCETLEWARGQRLEVLRNGFVLGDIKSSLKNNKLQLTVVVGNGTDGHNVPTGFDAERIIFLQVDIKDANGEQIYLSGDRDPNGDLRDLHSLYVANGDIPLDKDLFNLQSKFLVRLARGGEREQVIAVNKSVSSRPFIRPELRPTVLYGRPLGARKHRQVIQANSSREAGYKVDVTNAAWPITADISLVVQMVPVNLIAVIAAAGFDYEMSPKTVAEQVVSGAEAIWQRQLSISQNGQIQTDTSIINSHEQCTVDAFNKGECKFENNVCSVL